MSLSAQIKETTSATVWSFIGIEGRLSFQDELGGLKMWAKRR
ncbi:MAG: hypothetical protein ACLTK0_09590 [Anaerovoracaceae bacterium]